MGELLYFTVDKALSMGGEELANTIWKYKYNDEVLNTDDSEYTSWKESLPKFLDCVKKAGLNELHVAFEVETPTSEYIDALLMGRSKSTDSQEDGRILIVELKRWSTIESYEGKDTVTILKGKEKKSVKHPVSQILKYSKDMANNHHGIYKNGHITIDKIAYLHNFESDKNLLFDGSDDAMRKDNENKVFIKRDEKNLVDYLQNTFINIQNPDLIKIIEDDGYIMGEAGFSELAKAMKGDQMAQMVKDQNPIVDYVQKRIIKQINEPQKEIIVINGGPGTGKTIVGMHFICDYVEQAEKVNGSKNTDGAVFCLPRSKMVTIVMRKECGLTIPYMRSIGTEQKLVVVDEAHRIKKLNKSLDDLFNKGTKLLILLQDDHQLIRPGEEGTKDKIHQYANRKNIRYEERELTIQKRCIALGAIMDGLDNMLYHPGEPHLEQQIKFVTVFESLKCMDAWITEKAKSSRAKIIAPYCWTSKNNHNTKNKDINIRKENFSKNWIPPSDEEKSNWYFDNERTDLVSSIYTCQGLDMDAVGFIWWDDLKWDEKSKKWVADRLKSKDPEFKEKGIKSISEEDITRLFINTYYVMLSRARLHMGIWFHDEATKQHVIKYLGLKTIKNNAIFGTVTSVTASSVNNGKYFAYIKGDNGKVYTVPEWKFDSISDGINIMKVDNRVIFTPVGNGDYCNAENVCLL